MFTNYQMAEFCMYRYVMTPDLRYDEILNFYFGMQYKIEAIFDIKLSHNNIIMLAINTMTCIKKMEQENEY